MNNEQIREVFNGEFEAGIAAGSDPALADNQKLRIPRNQATACEIITTAMSYVTSDCIPNMECRKMAAAAIIAIVKYGLIDAECKDVQKVDVLGVGCDIVGISNQDISHALSVIISTKLNLLTMNHHVGQGKLQGYPSKVITSLYNATEATEHHFYTAAHMIGHWASTHLVLNKIGITGVKTVQPYITGSPLIIAEDIKLRLDSHPAGCAKLYVAYSTLKRLVNSMVAPYCPDLANMSSIISEYKKVKTTPIRYHIGAEFLTGEARLTYDEESVNACLGRLGTFISLIYPKSTLSKSPLYNKSKVRVYENYDDYSDEFAAACTGMRDAAMKNITDALNKDLKMTIESNHEAVAKIKSALAGDLLDEDSDAETQAEVLPPVKTRERSTRTASARRK